MSRTILEDLLDCAQNKPDHLFLSWKSVDVTYKDFFTRVKQIAAWIKQNGLQPGDRVGLCVEDHLEYLSYYFGSLAAAVVPALLWPQKDIPDLEYACSHVDASCLITSRPELKGVLSVPVLVTPEPITQQEEFWSDIRAEVAHMMFTSGTTSSPKAVMLSHENVIFVTDTLIQMASMKPSDHEVIYMPLYSTGGLGHVHALIRRGASAHLLPHSLWSIDDSQLSYILDLVEREKVTGFLTTITLLDRLRSSHREEFAKKCKNLKFITVNIAPLPPELVADLVGLAPQTRLCHYYGATEASRSVYQCFNDNPGKYDCSGKPAPGVQISLRNKDPETGVGEVVIKGGNVMLGYWSEKDKKKDPDPSFITGDFGFIDEDGFLSIKGRVRDNISVDGKRFLPGEVEAVIKTHPMVKDCAVVALSDPHCFQKPGAAIVLKENHGMTSIPEELFDLCCDQLEPVKAPKTIAIMQSLPRSEQGKVQRREITRALENDDIANCWRA